jgi:hypothetical protein
MKKFEKIIIGAFLGGTFPLLFGACWLLLWFYFDKNESRALYYLLSGMLLGLVIDIRFLKGWVDKRYELPDWITAAIYIFYNMLPYGMFMGFPVFNLIMGIPAGYYCGQKILYTHTPAEESRKRIQKVSVFTGLVMIVFCIGSGFIALKGTGVGLDVQAMLGLGFKVTKPMLLAIAVIGGTLLVWLQIVVTRITAKKVLSIAERHDKGEKIAEQP